MSQELCYVKLFLKLGKFICSLRLHKDPVRSSPAQGRHSNIALQVNNNTLLEFIAEWIYCCVYYIHITLGAAIVQSVY